MHHKKTNLLLLSFLFFSCNQQIKENTPSTCDECNGVGEKKIECVECGGTGTANCYNCNGNGFLRDCFTCESTGFEQCFHCNGRGGEYDSFRETFSECFFLFWTWSKKMQDV